MQKILEKKEFEGFIKKLMKKNDVIAPVKREITKFDFIKSPDEINLKEITLMPLKEFFIPEEEILFEFEDNKIKNNKEKEKQRIVFGMRKCDLNALLVLDKVMTDPLYIQKRKNTVLIGMFCENPDKYCFCNSMELTDYYDLFFYPEDDNYYISIGSKKGSALVKDLKKAEKEIKIPLPKNTKNLVDKDIGDDYHNKKWNSDVEKCLSCGACTIYCPTCNCFDIKDISELDSTKGARIRKQASCQLKSFSQVGGGKVFRDSRSSRFKHFVYHKIDYYKKHYNKYMCVGCGRCLRVCPPKIDWVETINTIKGVKNGI
jgi:sulfhydrogenase subunit beta (sulfur reductase)